MSRWLRQREVDHLPARYLVEWIGVFLDLVGPLPAGASVLDVGSGRRPAVPLDVRPANCRYVGLDVDGEELRRAPAGSYDEIVVCDVLSRRPDLASQFDLIVSWQVLEHVSEPELAVANLRSYLRPGGRLVALLSGRNAVFAVVNRIVPDRAGHRLGAAVTAREEETVFRAHYRACSYDGLVALFADWTRVTIRPEYRGEVYFRFSPALHRLYLLYETWTWRRGLRNLATHYYVRAET